MKQDEDLAKEDFDPEIIALAKKDFTKEKVEVQ